MDRKRTGSFQGVSQPFRRRFLLGIYRDGKRNRTGGYPTIEKYDFGEFFREKLDFILTTTLIMKP